MSACPFCDCHHDCTAEARERIAELEAELAKWKKLELHTEAQITLRENAQERERIAIARAEKAEAEVERLQAYRRLDSLWVRRKGRLRCSRCGHGPEFHLIGPGGEGLRCFGGGGRESGERRRGTVNRDEAPPGIIGGSQTAAIPAVPCTEPRCIREDPHDIPFGCKNLSEDEASEAKHLLWLRKDAARKERDER